MASLRASIKNKEGGTPSSSFTQEPKQEQEHVKAWVKYLVYPQKAVKDTLQYYVLQCDNPHTNKKVTCIGNLFNVQVGDYLEFVGNYKTDKKGRLGFYFETASRVETDEYGCTSLLSYLFGPKSAEKVISNYKGDSIIAFETFKFTEDTFRREMAKVKGIGPKKIDKAYVKYHKNLEVEELYQKFFKFSLSINQAIKIINKWGTRANEIMQRNVYDLLTLDGFRFETVDNIATGYYHIDKEDKRRVKAVLIQLLNLNSSMTGDCYMELNGPSGLINEAQKHLNISAEVIRENVIELKHKKILETEMLGNDVIIYTSELYNAETNVAQVISSMLRNNTIVKRNKIDDMIRDYEDLKGFKLAEKQKEAIKTSACKQFSIISGPPGSGKTTIVDAICTIFKQSRKNIRIKLCAPTGRAAKRMMDSTGLEASTIHRLLGYNSMEFKYNENNPIPNVDVLIVDEFSMTDVRMANRLMLAIPMDTVVIIVGDKDQLPSVDCGQVLTDLLKVNHIPKTVLEEIYRQKKGSTTLQRALDLSQDREVDLTDADDFTFIEVSGEEAVKQKVMDTFFEEVKKYGIDNVSLLVPQNVGPLGTKVLNELIRDVINPKHANKKEIKIGRVRFYRQYDKVIALKNYAEEEVFNGMVGTVTKILNEDNPMEAEIVVDFGDDIELSYTRDMWDDLGLAYATTIHKAQGSEMQSVIMLMDEHQAFMNRKKLVYTGWTRVKTELHVVGQKKMVRHAQKNEEPERKTRLVARFSEYEI